MQEYKPYDGVGPKFEKFVARKCPETVLQDAADSLQAQFATLTDNVLEVQRLNFSYDIDGTGGATLQIQPPATKILTIFTSKRKNTSESTQKLSRRNEL